MKSFGSVVAVFAFSFSGTAIAETMNNFIYVQVGADTNGNPITLDLSSIKGTEYNLLHKHGSDTLQTTLHASCGEGRLFSTRVSLYTLTGKLTSDDKTVREIFPKPGTAEHDAMEIVCQGAGINPNYLSQDPGYKSILNH